MQVLTHEKYPLFKWQLLPNFGEVLFLIWWTVRNLTNDEVGYKFFLFCIEILRIILVVMNYFKKKTSHEYYILLIIIIINRYIIYTSCNSIRQCENDGLREANLLQTVQKRKKTPRLKKKLQFCISYHGFLDIWLLLTRKLLKIIKPRVSSSKVEIIPLKIFKHDTIIEKQLSFPPNCTAFMFNFTSFGRSNLTEYKYVLTIDRHGYLPQKYIIRCKKSIT